MSWLVTGGAGYIGAHVVHAMTTAGEQVVVLDDLSTGDPGRLAELPGVPLVVGSVRDRGLVRRVLREHAVQGVVHVAGKKQVAESVADPLTYYAENVEGLVALLESCRARGVARFVFSSSAAVYGTPESDPVTEDAPCRPLSPYGQTKLVGEWLLRDCAAAWGLAATALRYFNVAGAVAPRLGDSARPTWCRWSSRPWTPAAPRSCSATTTARPTAPASGTTCTSRTSRRAPGSPRRQHPGVLAAAALAGVDQQRALGERHPGERRPQRLRGRCRPRRRPAGRPGAAAATPSTSGRHGRGRPPAPGRRTGSGAAATSACSAASSAAEHDGPKTVAPPAVARRPA